MNIYKYRGNAVHATGVQPTQPLGGEQNLAGSRMPAAVNKPIADVGKWAVTTSSTPRLVRNTPVQPIEAPEHTAAVAAAFAEQCTLPECCPTTADGRLLLLRRLRRLTGRAVSDDVLTAFASAWTALYCACPAEPPPAPPSEPPPPASEPPDPGPTPQPLVCAWRFDDGETAPIVASAVCATPFGRAVYPWVRDTVVAAWNAQYPATPVGEAHTKALLAVSHRETGHWYVGAVDDFGGGLASHIVGSCDICHTAVGIEPLFIDDATGKPLAVWRPGILLKHGDWLKANGMAKLLASGHHALAGAALTPQSPLNHALFRRVLGAKDAAGLPSFSLGPWQWYLGNISDPAVPGTDADGNPRGWAAIARAYFAGPGALLALLPHHVTGPHVTSMGTGPAAEADHLPFLIHHTGDPSRAAAYYAGNGTYQSPMSYSANYDLANLYTV